MTWKQIQQSVNLKREQYAALKKARTCEKDGAWMERAGDYHYECPKCGVRRLRKRTK
jgi:tRNA(Ile2) C34 agmatinyltransferase TiaS